MDRKLKLATLCFLIALAIVVGISFNRQARESTGKGATAPATAPAAVIAPQLAPTADPPHLATAGPVVANVRLGPLAIGEAIRNSDPALVRAAVEDWAALTAEWSEFERRHSQAPPVWKQERTAEWRRMNAARLDRVKKSLGREPWAVGLPSPELVADMASPFVQPTPAASVQMAPLAHFKTERSALLNERDALLSQVPEKGEPEVIRLLDEWRQVNADRLRSHRQMALDLGEPSVDEITAEGRVLRNPSIRPIKPPGPDR